MNTDRRSGVLDAAAIVLGNTDRPTDLQFVVGNRDDDDESKKAAKNGFSSSCRFDLLPFSPCTMFIYSQTDGVWLFPSYLVFLDEQACLVPC